MTRNYRNRQLTIERIKPYLKAFNLGGLTLKCEAMIHRLYQFSQDCDTWKILYVACPSRYRGQATGSRANRPSAKRARDQFGDDERLEQTTHASKCAAISLPDRHTAQDRDNADEWMNLVLNECKGDAAGMSRNNQATGPAIAVHGSGDSGGEQLTHKSEESHMYNLKEAVTSGMANIISAVGHMESKLLTSHSTDNSNKPNNHCQLLQITHSNFSGQNILATTSRMPEAYNELRTDAPDTITASPAMPITFDPAKVPSIPAISFADDIPGLAKNWHSSNLLVLGGHGIPIKHWDKIYKARFNIKKNAWKSFRSTYSDWQFLSYPTEADFWKAYTNETGRLPYQKILNKIEQKCIASKADFSVDVDVAREFFDHDLSKAPRSSRQGEASFSYRKSGKWYVKKSDQKIAKAWQLLLEQDDEIRERWEMLQKSSKTGTV
ncbi:hypothetical protein EDD85DRAFT_984103 [Armillaria nabsnona]|nr:hypothetical protein EDD85DRAFT_984103 [Armillaria nabsnona]